MFTVLPINRCHIPNVNIPVKLNTGLAHLRTTRSGTRNPAVTELLEARTLYELRMSPFGGVGEIEKSPCRTFQGREDEAPQDEVPLRYLGWMELQSRSSTAPRRTSMPCSQRRNPRHARVVGPSHGVGTDSLHRYVSIRPHSNHQPE